MQSNYRFIESSQRLAPNVDKEFHKSLWKPGYSSILDFPVINVQGRFPIKFSPWHWNKRKKCKASSNSTGYGVITAEGTARLFPTVLSCDMWQRELLTLKTLLLFKNCKAIVCTKQSIFYFTIVDEVLHRWAAFPLCKCPVHVVRIRTSRRFIWMEVRCMYMLCYTKEIGSMHWCIERDCLAFSKPLALPPQFA